MPAAEGLEMPVPPPPAVKVPVNVGWKVWISEAAVIVNPTVSPLKADVVVARV